jgi:hypothetical protein
MMSKRDVLLLTAGVFLAVVGRGVWRWVCEPTPIHAIALDQVSAGDRLWVAFQDFLGREDEQLRVFPPPGGDQLTHYQGQTGFFERFLVAGQQVVRHEELRRLGAAERIERVLEAVERDYPGRQPEKAAALLADLRRVLTERAAALEVLRFSTPGYAQDLLDRDLRVRWSVVWDDVGRRQSLRGSIDDLYRRRVAALTEAMEGK